MDAVEQEGKFGKLGGAEVVLDPDGGHQGIGFEDGPSAEDEFNAHDAEGGIGLYHAHGEIAGHFLGEFADAVEAGIDHGAHAGESGAFGEARKFGVVEVAVANEVIVFAFFDGVDFTEEGAEVIYAAEVFEV